MKVFSLKSLISLVNKLLYFGKPLFVIIPFTYGVTLLLKEHQASIPLSIVELPQPYQAGKH